MPFSFRNKNVAVTAFLLEDFIDRLHFLILRDFAFFFASVWSEDNFHGDGVDHLTLPDDLGFGMWQRERSRLDSYSGLPQLSRSVCIWLVSSFACLIT